MSFSTSIVGRYAFVSRQGELAAPNKGESRRDNNVIIVDVQLLNRNSSVTKPGLCVVVHSDTTVLQSLRVSVDDDWTPRHTHIDDRVSWA